MCACVCVCVCVCARARMRVYVCACTHLCMHAHSVLMIVHTQKGTLAISLVRSEIRVGRGQTWARGAWRKMAQEQVDLRGAPFLGTLEFFRFV